MSRLKKIFVNLIYNFFSKVNFLFSDIKMRCNMFRTDVDYSEKLKTVLKEQYSVLSEIYDTQKKIRENVNERDWNELQGCS